MNKIITFLVLFSVSSYSQEIVVDRLEDIKFNENNISITIKREEIVFFNDKLLMIKSEDDRNKNGYSEFVFSDHVIRLLERAYEFEKIKSEKTFNKITFVTDENNKSYKILINKNKISTIKVEKITQIRSMAKVNFDGLKETFEFIGTAGMIQSLIK